MARNWAITIGINEYRYLQPLRYGMSDAEAVRQFFKDELRFDHIYHFTDQSPPIPQDYGADLLSQPTSTTLGRFLRKRFEQPFLKTGDNLWFFFAGHGIRHENRDYLMPIDGDREDLARTAIPLHYVSERLRRSGADNIIMLIDACRDAGGRRDGNSFGEERQQGVVTLYACSPEEASYEMEEIGGGAFTYALLESLKIQGAANCATVERLYQRLRNRVPQLVRSYRKATQTPYGRIEPLSKKCLILLPQQASATDLVTLKNEALSAEVAQRAELSKQLWTRVLMVAPGDSEAIAGIERLSQHRAASGTRQRWQNGLSERIASIREQKRTPKQILWLSVRSASIYTVGISTIWALTLALTRPCVVGECDLLQSAQTQKEEALGSINLGLSIDVLNAAKEQIEESIQALRQIPPWSVYRGEARSLISDYEHRLSVLTLTIEAQQKMEEIESQLQETPKDDNALQFLSDDLLDVEERLEAAIRDMNDTGVDGDSVEGFLLEAIDRKVSELQSKSEKFSQLTSTQRGSGCDNLLFNLDEGTLNGLTPTASWDAIKEALPCYTGDTEEGAEFNNGGGVFSLSHDFYFYTYQDYVEVRSDFLGRVSPDVLGEDSQVVAERLGEPTYTETFPSQTAYFYEKAYGCLVLDIKEERADEIRVYSDACDK